MKFFKNIFSGQAKTIIKEVRIHVDDDLMGKNILKDERLLVAMFMDYINKNPEGVDGEVMDMLTKKKLSLKKISMEKPADDRGTDLKYLVEFS